MVDKKTAAIAVLCVATILCLGLWANEYQEAQWLEGELCEYWNVFSYTHSVESLYIGETYSHDFTLITEDMTSYKVLAVAG